MNESLTTWFRSTRDVISVTGADSVTFLQGQISADVVGLGVADSTTSLILSPAGKIDAWCRVTRTAADAVTTAAAATARSHRGRRLAVPSATSSPNPSRAGRR